MDKNKTITIPYDMWEDVLMAFEDFYRDLRCQESDDMEYEGASSASYFINTKSFRELRDSIYRAEDVVTNECWEE